MFEGVIPTIFVDLIRNLTFLFLHDLLSHLAIKTHLAIGILKRRIILCLYVDLLPKVIIIWILCNVIVTVFVTIVTRPMSLTMAIASKLSDWVGLIEVEAEMTGPGQPCTLVVKFSRREIGLLEE